MTILDEARSMALLETADYTQSEASQTFARVEAAQEVMRRQGWEPRLSYDEADTEYGAELYLMAAAAGFYGKTLPLAFVAIEILAEEHPMTLRGLFYRVVSAGWLPDTGRSHYDRLGRIMTTLREKGIIPFSWLVDHIRSTLKPSSWAGLADFADTCRDAYRLDFWARLPRYVHVFCEKDAMAGVLAPVTREYDIALSVIRGFVSLSFAHEIAELWNQIDKPIIAYYLGDHDPSGLSLEDDLRDKLTRYCKQAFTWKRLAVLPEDFADYDLFPLAPKGTDTRTRWFRSLGFEECAELDAIPANDLRDRLERAILKHIPTDEWERLRQIEVLEREQWQDMLAKFGKVASA